ncbi:MAG TPA: GDP-mannose 4,6-dehydratase, partial [Methanocella sp.]|nr:GDP-mannose 4,6-dehydratase [Methanocella sp.]
LKNRIIKVGNTDPTRDFLYIDDAIRAFLIVGEKGTGIFNIGSGKETKIADLVMMIRDAIDPSIEIVSAEERKRAGKVEIPRLCADTGNIKRIGWGATITLPEGIEKMVIK